MKKLQLQPRIYEHQFDRISKLLNAEIPQELKSILQDYAELGVRENTYSNALGKVFPLASFCSYRMIYDFLEEFNRGGFEKIIPFAIDNGGWVYCLSIDENIYGKVYLFQMEMPYENEIEAFEFVANSFEEFIDGLQPEELES